MERAFVVPDSLNFWLTPHTDAYLWDGFEVYVAGGRYHVAIETQGLFNHYQDMNDGTFHPRLVRKYETAFGKKLEDLLGEQQLQFCRSSPEPSKDIEVYSSSGIKRMKGVATFKIYHPAAHLTEDIVRETLSIFCKEYTNTSPEIVFVGKDEKKLKGLAKLVDRVQSMAQASKTERRDH